MKPIIRIVVVSILDVAQFVLPALVLAGVITYTAWCWSMDIPISH